MVAARYAEIGLSRASMTGRPRLPTKARNRGGRSCRRTGVDRRLICRDPLWSVAARNHSAARRPLSGGQGYQAEDSFGSAPAARSPAPTGGYAAHSGRTALDRWTIGLVAGSGDAVRPQETVAGDRFGASSCDLQSAKTQRVRHDSNR